MIPSVTFADFRVRVAIELRDGLILTATSDGSQTSFIDNLNLTDGPDQYRNSHGIVISATNGANVGRTVRVDSSSAASTSLTFVGSGLPAITKAGDVLHLFNLGGNGIRPQYYDQEIRTALDAAYPDYVEEIVADGSAPFAAAAPLIAVPEQFVAVYAVEFGEEDAEWRTLPRARKAGRWGEGWTLARPTREIRVDGYWRDELDGLSYRVRGYKAHDALTAADTPVAIDQRWLLAECKGRLASRRGTDRSWQQWAVEWSRDAEQTRFRIMTPRQPNTEWL